MIATEHLQGDRSSRIKENRQVAGSASHPNERAKVAGPLHIRSRYI
jgi:hypothetical protein